MSSPVVDLRSDAVTLPSRAMRDAMAAARVGDDDFREDPTIRLLEERMAELLGKEAALFVISGTMGNLLGILTQSQRGQAIVAGLRSHIYDHEFPGIRPFCGVALRPVAESVDRGCLTWDMQALRSMLGEPLHSRPALLCLEQTVNRLGGVVMPLRHMAKLSALARGSGLKVHLDGARLFNATLALGAELKDLARCADTVMTVFTKCLGAPLGAIFAGPENAIDMAREQRHYLGGGMKQAGVIAAACLVALDQIDGIVGDHRRARELAERLAALPRLGVQPENVVSNMVLVDVRPLGIGHEAALARIRERGILALRAMPGILRLVIHRDIDDDGIERTVSAFEELELGTRDQASEGT